MVASLEIGRSYKCFNADIVILKNKDKLFDDRYLTMRQNGKTYA